MTGFETVRGSVRLLLGPAVALVLGAGGGPAPAAAADAPGTVTRPLAPSNTALLARAAHGAARQLVAQVPLAAGTQVGLRAEGDGALDADMREALLQALNERRIRCLLLAPAADGAGGDSLAAAGGEDRPRPSGPGGGSGTVTPGLGDATDLAAIARQAAEAQAGYERLQAERREQEARADSLARLGGGGGARDAARDATPADLPVLTWRVQEARVDYVRMFRGGLFGAQRVERRARADLALRLAPAGGEAIAWSASADSTVGDVVLRSELAALEDRTRPETRPQLPSASFKKVLEPALVVVLVAGLVSLFYQNRP